MIYDYLDYRDYLERWIRNHSSRGYGMRKKIAEYLGCQSTLVSQVLHKDMHFSLEHGFKLNGFLRHTPEEADYFVLLLLYQRASSKETRTYFREKIDSVHKSRLILKNRLKSQKGLSPEDQARYYSEWFYGAIHMLVAVPEYRRKETIAERLRLSPKTISEVLDFLTRTGLVGENNGDYFVEDVYTHLGNDSPLIGKHHSNWRLHALRSIAEEKSGDVHYSLATALSKEDVIRIKTKIVDWIEEIQSVARPSPSETVCGFCLDWFEV